MNEDQRDSYFSIIKLFNVHVACIWGKYFDLLLMSYHNKDKLCFQAAYLGALWLSDRMESFDMVNKVVVDVDMVNKVVVDMVNKVVVDMVNKVVVDMVNKVVVDMVNKVVDGLEVDKVSTGCHTVSMSICLILGSRFYFHHISSIF